MWTNGWTDKRTKIGQTNTRNFTNFKRNLAMMVIYVPVKYEFDWINIFELESGNENVARWMDRQRDKQEESACERALCQLTECF